MQSLAESLLYVPIFSDLPQNVLDEIASIGTQKNYKKNETIFLENDPGTALFFIISGKVKISRTSDDGKEVILSIISENDFFGEMAILDGMSRSASVIATEDSELYIIKREDFLELIKKHPEVSITLLSELTSRLRAADMKIKSLSLKDAEGKVATVILQIADDVGKIKRGVVEIEKLPLQQDLANMAGTSRETISRTLHSFVKKGMIELEGSKLRILDYEKFKEAFA